MTDDLAMDSILYSLAEADIKRITIRKGHREYQHGETVVIYDVQNPEKKVERELFSVHHCLAKEVSIEDLKDDGFTDHEDFYFLMQDFYPGFEKDTPVTVLIW